MIDPDEMEAFEEWKAAKLAGQSDLSVQAWNREQEALALAWEDGAKTGVKAVRENAAVIEEVLPRNPHRKPGMTSHTPRRVTG